MDGPIDVVSGQVITSRTTTNSLETKRETRHELTGTKQAV
jgi:hypothetical protein